MKKLQKLSKKLSETNVLNTDETFYITGGEERTSWCWSKTDTCHDGISDVHFTRSKDGEVITDTVTDCDENCGQGQ